MKYLSTLVALLVVLFLFTSTDFTNESQNQNRSDKSDALLIGSKAPSFKTNSTQGEINFPDDFYAKWKIIFSHPADFTPVCSTELLELALLNKEFKKKNTELLVLSTDGLNSHIEWVKSLESVEYKGQKGIKIDFPIVTDLNMEISKKYGMLHPGFSSTKTVRGVFIINPDNKIEAIFFYPYTIGRNFDEIVRTLTALQLNYKKDYLIPANWTEGNDVLIQSPASIEESEKLAKKENKDLYSLNWYIWFKKME